MKLNNRGITLTEIIISIALISLVLIFLFSLLVTVNDINKESEVNSTYLVNKSLILKNIEEDFSKASSIVVDNCSVDDVIYKKYNKDDNYFTYEDGTYSEKLKAEMCLHFNYGSSSGYLGIYYYKPKNSYVISYINDNNSIKATRLLPDFEKYNVDDEGKFKKSIIIEPNNYTYGNKITDFFTIKIPIIGSDEKDYSILISYYGK